MQFEPSKKRGSPPHRRRGPRFAVPENTAVQLPSPPTSTHHVYSLVELIDTAQPQPGDARRLKQARQADQFGISRAAYLRR